MYFKRKHLKRDPNPDGGGTAEDRGDDFTPTDDDAASVVVVEPKAAATAVEEVVSPFKKAADKAAPADEAAAADEAASADEAAKTKAKDTRIPASRHKEILDKERARREAVEAELAQYKQGKQIAELGAQISEAETQLVKLEREYAQQLTDGKVNEAALTMTQIRKTERAINEQNSLVREQAAVARAVESVRFDTTVDRIEALFPALNAKHEDFDKEKTGEVLELKEMYQTRGYTPSAALQKAVALIMPPETKRQEAALETEARVDPAAVEAARKAAAVKATSAAVAATPANAAKVGQDSDTRGGGAVTAKDVIKMKYEDFAKLDDETLARARGDLT